MLGVGQDHLLALLELPKIVLQIDQLFVLFVVVKWDARDPVVKLESVGMGVVVHYYDIFEPPVLDHT